MVEDVADALGDEAEVGGLAPNQEVEGDVEELSAVIGGITAAVVIGDPDVGLLAEVGAPIGVVFEELLAEAAEDSGVEGVDVVRRRSESHLSVGEVEDEMLPLVPNIVALEPEEEGEPVEEVVVRLPLGERRSPEVSDGEEGGGGGADLGEAEGGVVVEEVVDGDDVVRLFLSWRSRRRLWRSVTVAKTHSIEIGNPRRIYW